MEELAEKLTVAVAVAVAVELRDYFPSEVT